MKELLRRYKKRKKELLTLEQSLERLYDRLESVPTVSGKVEKSGDDFPYIREHISVEVPEPAEATRIKLRISEKERQKTAVLAELDTVESYIAGLPEGLEKIEKELFGYCRALTSITIPGRVARIEKGAFSGCDHLKDIVIPDSVKEIDPGWRETQPPCKMKLTIHTTPGSYAEWFARENKIRCKLLPS